VVGAAARYLLAAVVGAAVGLVVCVVLLFVVALGVMTVAPTNWYMDQPPEFLYLWVGVPAGLVLGAILGVLWLRRRAHRHTGSRHVTESPAP
jgi:Na+-driven multidrug efflux pump